MTQVNEDSSIAAVWTAMQVEVDLLLLTKTALQQASGDGSLDALRGRFHDFHDRLASIENNLAGPLLRNDRRFLSSMSRLLAVRDSLARIENKPDEELRLAVDDMIPRLLGLHPDAREVALAAMRRFREASQLHRNASNSMLHWTALILLGVFGLLFIATAILRLRDREAVRRQLQAESERNTVDTLLEMSPDGLLILDADLQVLHVNEKFADMTGTAQEKACGRPVTVFATPGAEQERLRRYCEEVFASRERAGAFERLELSLLRQGGGIFDVLVEGVTFTTERKGRLLVLHIRDATGQKSATALLDSQDGAIESNRIKSQFLELISHELRTPLTGIQGALDLVQSDPLTSRQEEAISIAQASTAVMIRDISDILDYVDLRNGGVAFRAEPLDLDVILQDTRRLLDEQTNGNGNRIEIALHRPPTQLRGDPGRIRQVMLVLVDNAMKFTRDGVVRLGVRPQRITQTHIQLRFWVEDDGPGMEPARQPYIFDDFTSLDSGYTRQTQGIGLGLPIAQAIVQHMGSRIVVDSAPGQGSRFYFDAWFELLDAASPPPRASDGALIEEADRSHRSLHILLAEDNPINARLMKSMIGHLGHEACVASSGFEAVRLATEERFDIVLMDVSMPGLDGLEATRIIQASEGPNRNCPIVGFTAHALPDARDRFLSTGMAEVLVKPVNLATLRTMLERQAASAPLTLDDSKPGPPASQAADPLLDEAQAATLTSYFEEGDLSRQIAEIRDEALRDITALEQAHAEGDVIAVRRHAHRLVGMASFIGARRLHTYAKAIELSDDNTPLDDMNLKIKLLSDSLLPTILALNALFDES